MKSSSSLYEASRFRVFGVIDIGMRERRRGRGLSEQCSWLDGPGPAISNVVGIEIGERFPPVEALLFEGVELRRSRTQNIIGRRDVWPRLLASPIVAAGQ